MKIAVALENNEGEKSIVAAHFGRCPFYAFVDIEDNEVRNVEILQNPFFSSHQPGVVPQFIAEKGATIMISGGMGRRAMDWFEQLGVKAVVGVSGTLEQAVEKILKGEDIEPGSPCKGDKDCTHSD